VTPVSEAPKPATVAIPTETLQRFAASIAHALSNRLSIIMGNAQYLILSRERDAQAPRGEPDELTSTLEAILSETERVAFLVTLLLTFSSRVGANGASSQAVLNELERLATTLMAPHRSCA
jgi:signal transduction histidine kinase